MSNPNAASIANGTWNTIDAFAPGAKWRATNTLAGQPLNTYRTLTEWLALAPDLHTHSTVGGVYLVAGASLITPGWSSYQGYVDSLDITVAGTTTAYGIDNPAPLAVDGLAASNITSSGFDVSWSAAPHATSYDVKVGTVITSQTGVTKAVTGIAPNTAVLVQVRARNSAGVSPWEIVLATTSSVATTVVRTATITMAPNPTVFGSVAIIGGVLKADGVGVAAQQVTVARKAGTRWITIGTARTTADGTWRLPIRASFRTSALHAEAAGFPTATGTLRVASKVTALVNHRTVRAYVAPVLTGHWVYLQVRSAGVWKNVTRTTLAAGSRATFTAPAAGVYRVIVPATSGYQHGISTAFAVR